MSKEKTKLIDLSSEALSEHGHLAESISDFKVRSEQQKMAAAIAEAISTQQDLVAEAATGIGKTFAYLVPALLSGKRTIVS
ncbi:MAG: ATP-dependent helicase, partial [Gammaproteobacteria bacterium]|nr:ATP-dependent helicase [Gammaproteobacteria bacterium]